jgi:capsular polysaccharide transport system permease protein
MNQAFKPIRKPPSIPELMPRLLRRLAALRDDTITLIGPERRLGVFGWSFVICVILPTIIAGIYLILIASRQYVAEARFAVRTAVEINAASGTEALSLIASLSSSSSTMQDAFIVADYIESRTIIEDLGGKDIVHAVYSRPEIDWFSRLPGNQTLEKIWKYWKKEIDVTIDTPTGIITLAAYAFRAQDAQRLAALIVQQSERLVNQISERSRSDALLRANAEVQLAQERLGKAREELLDYRNRTNILNPEQSATSIGSIIGQLMVEKLELENQMASTGGSLSADAPTNQFARARITNLDSEIKELQEKMTSESQNSALSEQIAGYEERQLKQQFAEKVYEIAQASYERAREEQDKQQLYLVTIVRPTLPEEAAYPRRLIDTGLIFSVCLILWSMIALMVAAVRDHME